MFPLNRAGVALWPMGDGSGNKNGVYTQQLSCFVKKCPAPHSIRLRRYSVVEWKLLGIARLGSLLVFAHLLCPSEAAGIAQRFRATGTLQHREISR